ncbi:MAG: MerR family transcriptional regulator [Dehalococcoidia bacterium]|nr:MerR family transcriptional regulator [Dehalococcoidia bacterium]
MSERPQADLRQLAIAAASEALDLHPQTLRKYERAGLLRPGRREGGSRRYSSADLERLALIKHLAEVRRVNVAGMALALALRDELVGLLAEVEERDPHDAHVLVRERLTALILRLHE